MSNKEVVFLLLVFGCGCLAGMMFYHWLSIENERMLMEILADCYGVVLK